jgi:hypothetical protein
MENIHYYFDEMISGPDGIELYKDVMRYQKVFYEIANSKKECPATLAVPGHQPKPYHNDCKEQSV